MSVPKPENEDKRLEILEQYQIMDSLAEAAYDEIVAVASEIFDTPMALITFVDDDRQWFKAQTGMTMQETAREHAFCAHTILDDGILVVEDARKDPRFATNPYVLGDPNIRFYAGAPIKVKNTVNLGSVCVLDSKPRQITTKQEKLLKLLSSQVSHLLELRRMTADLRQEQEQNTQLRQLLPICAWCKQIRTADGSWTELEQYVRQHADQELTHSICPSCSSRLNADLDLV